MESSIELSFVDEFRRLGFACVAPNDVDIVWAFIECLTRCQSHFFSASHLHLALVDGDIGKQETAVKNVETAIKHFGTNRCSGNQCRNIQGQAVHGVHY